MIFAKKHYITPGLLKSLLFQSFYWVTGPWNKIRKDCAVAAESIGDLNQNKIPVLINPSGLPPKCLVCQQCVEVCPTQCLGLITNDLSHVRSFKIYTLNCISCTKCVDVCLDNILVMQNIGLGPGPVESEWMLELIGFAVQETRDKLE